MCFSVQAGAFLLTRALGRHSSDSLAVVIEAGFRNVSLAVAVKAVVFPAREGALDPIGDAVLFAILLYGGVSMFLSLIPVFINRRFVAAQNA